MVEFRQWSEEEPVEVDKPLDLDEEVDWVAPWQRGKDGLPRRGASIYKIGALPVSLMIRVLRQFSGISADETPDESNTDAVVAILTKHMSDNFEAARVAVVNGLKGIEWPEHLRDGQMPAFKAVIAKQHGLDFKQAHPEIVERLPFNLVIQLSNAIIDLSRLKEPEKKV